MVPGTRWSTPAHWALLDCPDTVRLDRPTAGNRPRNRIDEATEDAAQARALVPTAFDGGADPSALTERVLGWTRRDGR
ncbi:hypothetical protein [Streptosporangium sp. NPDC020145]|uniref:hypothetical protein n=1 Tax=Streptosporangium sp. NPDC020145 TaxID=3154694 RepID=UPI00342CE2F8